MYDNWIHATFAYPGSSIEFSKPRNLAMSRREITPDGPVTTDNYRAIAESPLAFLGRDVPIHRTLGPNEKLNEAVAKVCGITRNIYFVGQEWRPATNLDHAFEAAAHVKLFERGYVLVYLRDAGWLVEPREVVGHVTGCGRRGSTTAAEEICRAILKLATKHEPSLPV